MVVLIVGISMAAYVAYQLLGAESGAVVGGILGGLISSTATTVSYARQTRGSTQGGGNRRARNYGGVGNRQPPRVGRDRGRCAAVVAGGPAADRGDFRRW